jgi:uncharacterized protein (TIGR00369 family)
LEHLRRIAAGELPPPPFGALLNLKFAELEEGRVVFTAAPIAQHYNLIGTVHGGYIATLLDSAMGCAVLSKLRAGVGWTTLELKVNYIRALTIESGTVRCEGVTLHAGRKVALAEGRVTDAAGKLLAHGTTTCLIIQP